MIKSYYYGFQWLNNENEDLHLKDLKDLDPVD